MHITHNYGLTLMFQYRSQSQSVDNGDSEDSSLQLIAKPSPVIGDTPPNSLMYVANELIHSQGQAQVSGVSFICPREHLQVKFFYT